MGKATPFPKKAATSEEDAQFEFIPLEYSANWRHFGLANQKFSKHQKTILSAGKRDISFPDPGNLPELQNYSTSYCIYFRVLK